MPIIHLVGPNAIGKTTAVVRWAARYAGLVPKSLDLIRRPGYDTREEKQARCSEWNNSGDIVVVESARTSQLTVVSCDTGGNGAILEAGKWVPDPGWKGDQAEKERKVLDLRGKAAISVCESARTTTTTTTFALADEPVILLTCPGEVLGKHLRARCTAKGKRFRDDYWNPDKLAYESSRRYLNFASKNLRAEQVKHFRIDDQARDWPAVDEYFGSLFRRIHNELNRRRQG